MKSFNNYGPAIKALQHECAWKLSRVRVLYRAVDGTGHYHGRPAQRYIDSDGQVRYRPWAGPIGGAWIKGRKTSIDSQPKE